MKTKTFDCVEMKHQAQEMIREKTKHMTQEELLAYWDEGTQELLRRQAELRDKIDRSAA
jgi:hypothetical protein